MYKDYYQLSAEPFGLTPDSRFVFVHESLRNAQASMHHCLQQGDGFLVVTGRSGMGKTTLAESFIAALDARNTLTATLVSTNLGNDDLLRMVTYLFGLDARGVDKATLLRNFEQFLKKQSRVLLIIDEAQNLTDEALEEVRMLTNLHVDSRPLLQIFFLGQEKFLERLHTREMEQLHQRVMAACVLKPLCLQETHDYIWHRLDCVNWHGNPAISAEALVLVHRFSQGIPRLISKLCTRLFLYGEVEQRNRLDLDDIVSVIQEMQAEQLLPITQAPSLNMGTPSPHIQDFVHTGALPDEQRLSLTDLERDFVESIPALAALPAAVETVETIETDTVLYPAPRETAEAPPPPPPVHVPAPWQWLEVGYDRLSAWRMPAYAAAAFIVVVAYLLGAYNAGDGVEMEKSKAVTSGSEPAIATSPPIAEPIEAPPAAGIEAVRIASRITEDYFANVLLASSPVSMASTNPEVDETAGPQIFAVHRAVESPMVDIVEIVTADVIENPVEVFVVEVSVAEVAVVEAPAVVTAEIVRERRAEKIMQLLILGDRALARDRLRLPENDSALGYYTQVLEFDHRNEAAELGLHRIAARYGQLAMRVMEKQQYERAELFINRGLSVVAEDSSLMALRQKVASERAEFLATQEREQQLALQAAEAQDAQPATSAKADSGGFFGAIKRIFVKPETQESPD